MAAPHFLRPALQNPDAFGVRVDRTGEWLVTRLRLAIDSDERRRGLLGRTGLETGEGLVIAPSQGVHTFGMAFPLDIVGVARDGRVVRIRESVTPRRLVFSWSAFAILELASGAAAQAGLRVGDRVTVAALASTGEAETPRTISQV
jgi:uncharacterized membrane protein (UPF0127 family)